MDDGRRQAADRDIAQSEDMIFRIEQQHGKMFLLFITEMRHRKMRGILRPMNNLHLGRGFCDRRRPSSTAARIVAAFDGPMP